MKRIRMDGFTLLDQGSSILEIEVGGTVVGRVTLEKPVPSDGDVDEVLVITDYSTDVDEDGGFGGVILYTQTEAWDYIRRVWKADIAEVRGHEKGEHRSGQRRPEHCPACATVLRLARDWQQSDSTFRDRDYTDDDIVSRYLFHAGRMSAS